MEQYNRQQYLDVVLKSPAAVTAGDQQAWVGIFSRYSLIEDPVGSAPHFSGVYDRRLGCRGDGPIRRFYNTFIAPNKIIFHVDRDIVAAGKVIRDLTIEIRMSATVIVHVPMHLVYELEEENGELRIRRLAAHWEMMPSIKQQMSYGRASLGVGLGMGFRMLRYLGFAGMLGFMRGLSSIGEPGKHLADTFIRFINGANAPGLNGLISDDCRLVYRDRELNLEQLLETGLTVSTGKILAAGNFISASCRVTVDGNELKGVIFLEFNRKTKKICAVNFYLE